MLHTTTTTKVIHATQTPNHHTQNQYQNPTRSSHHSTSIGWDPTDKGVLDTTTNPAITTTTHLRTSYQTNKHNNTQLRHHTTHTTTTPHQNHLINHITYLNPMLSTMVKEAYNTTHCHNGKHNTTNHNNNHITNRHIMMQTTSTIDLNHIHTSR